VSLAVRYVTRDEANAAVRRWHRHLRGVVVDAGVSGGTLLEDRAGGAQIAAHLRDGVAHVIVVKLDRLFRSTVDCLSTVQAWDRRGIALHLVDLGGAPIDTSSASGRMFLSMVASFAEFERALGAERTAAAMAEIARSGRYTGGRVPYGYELRPDGTLVANASERETIARARALRASGHSCRQSATALSDEGHVLRGRAVSPMAVWYMTAERPLLPRPGR